MKQLLAFLISCLLTGNAFATKSIVQYNLTEQQYQQISDSMDGKEFRPTDIDITTIAGKPRFAVIWMEDKETAWQTKYNMTEQAFNQVHKELTGKGYVIQNLIPYYTEQKQLRYAAVWDNRKGQNFFASHRLTEDQYIAAMDQYHEQGIYPFRITVYEHEGSYKFAVVWGDIGKVVNAYRNYMNEAEYTETIASMVDNGYYIMDLAAYNKEGRHYFSGFWVKLSMDSRTQTKLAPDELDKAIETNATNGLTPYIITGFAENGILYYSVTWDSIR